MIESRKASKALRDFTKQQRPKENPTQMSSPPMTKEEYKQRMRASQAKKKEKAKDGNDTGKGDFAARAQSAVDSRENKGDPPDNNSSKASQGQQGGQGQGQGQGGADQAGSA
ncbi:MAG: hypothetical protein LQ352_004557 [Teloschistes flavicans]|nr:MAG: hypothetical protein LQ352_004557 [Teloschistes flavicans]